jgi:cell division protein FtsB
MLLVTTLAAFVLLAPPAAAQSTSELRQENQRLRARVTDLERELEQARAENDELRAEIERLKQLVEELRKGTPDQPSGQPQAPAERKVTIDESDPSASPGSLLAALQTSYQENLGEFDMGEQSGDVQRKAFLRHVREWVAGANREFRMPIKWHVRIVEPLAFENNRFRIELQAVDPKTGVELDDPFDAVLSRREARRLEERFDRYSLDDTFMLQGVLEPGVRVNPDRATAGPFNNPPIVGPFAELLMTVDLQSLRPAPEPDDEDADDEQ